MRDLLPEMEEHRQQERRIDSATRNALFAIVAVNLIVIIVLGLALYETRRGEFQPFRFPEQKVLNRIPGHGDEPALWLGQPVVVRGEKCNVKDEAITVHGSKAWLSVLPPGNSVSTLTGSHVYKPGCVTRTFVNVVPSAVVAQMEELLRSRSYVVWQITGTLTSEHVRSSTRSWRTEPFYVYRKPG